MTKKEQKKEGEKKGKKCGLRLEGRRGEKRKVVEIEHEIGSAQMTKPLR